MASEVVDLILQHARGAGSSLTGEHGPKRRVLWKTGACAREPSPGALALPGEYPLQFAYFGPMRLRTSRTARESL